MSRRQQPPRVPLVQRLEQPPHKRQVGTLCSRHGEPAAEGSRLIAVSVYCGKIAAVIPAIEHVAGQQVFKQLF